MKILIIRTWPTFLDVTQNTYNIQEVGLAKALVKRGHSADILFWTNQCEQTITIPVENHPSIRIFYRHGASVLKNAWFYHIDRFAVNYDILQPAEYNQIFSWYLAGKYPYKTVIYHGPYYSPFNKNYNRMCRLFDVLFVGRYRRLGTRFLTKSNLARKFLLNKGLSAQNVTTVGVGIDAELLSDRDNGHTELEAKMRAQSSGMKLLYIGRIEPRRDPFFLLKILQEIRAAGQEACLYIIGDGEPSYVEQVSTFIREQGLEQFVFWQKKAPQNQMKGVYEQADFFLLPTEYEIFGMVLLEAMFFRRIVVTTPNGGSDMLLHHGQNGLVLKKDSPKQWAAEILELSHDPLRKKQLEQSAYHTVIHENTWDILAEHFEQVYCEKNARKDL